MNNLSEQPSIYIASFNMKGVHAPLPYNTIKINVTSCQNSNNPYRIAFSPMTPIKHTYKGFYCFENYWQSGKVFENIDYEKNILWWKKQIKGKKKNPSTKNKKILYSIYPSIQTPLNYIQSRKLIYLPEYYNLIKNNPILIQLKNNFRNGQSYTIYDLDGPRLDDNSPTSCLVTFDLIKKKLNNHIHPFGHGYIIACLLLNINYESLIE